MKIQYLAIALFLAGASSALGTDRFYPNQEVASSDGRYRATAISPDNAEGDFQVAFQTNFTITLHDLEQAKVLWTWKQHNDDLSPEELIPTTDGYLIMRNAASEYYVFDKQGTPKRAVGVFDRLTKQEQDTFTDWTTAGIFWSQYSKQGFFQTAHKQYFYIRTYWGHIIAIDIDDATVDDTDKLHLMIEDAVVQETRNIIKTFNGQYCTKCTDCADEHLREDLTIAAFVIKRHDIRDGRQLMEGILARTADNRNYDLKRYLDNLDPPSLCSTPKDPIYVIIGVLGIALAATILWKRRSLSLLLPFDF